MVYDDDDGTFEGFTELSEGKNLKLEHHLDIVPGDNTKQFDLE